jgi:hypothetical protein
MQVAAKKIQITFSARVIESLFSWDAARQSVESAIRFAFSAKSLYKLIIKLWAGGKLWTGGSLGQSARLVFGDSACLALPG